MVSVGQLSYSSVDKGLLNSAADQHQGGRARKSTTSPTAEKMTRIRTDMEDTES